MSNTSLVLIVDYRGLRIKLALTQLRMGGWIGNFMLIRDDGSEVEYVPNYGSPICSSQEAAKEHAVQRAMNVIDKL